MLRCALRLAVCTRFGYTYVILPFEMASDVAALISDEMDDAASVTQAELMIMADPALIRLTVNGVKA